ncbi:MAG TPA: ribosome-associated translation inhibitor RaiA [Bacteroidia bacterium]|jgi:putative sigma-54 modulation protein|nr:ribosome-associated translation inhibitor RaiA [Bacteroidia bacterium]
MTPKIQSVHFDADKKLIDFINEKVSKLRQFHDGIIDSDVILRLENSNDQANKTAEIKLHLKGSQLFAKKQCSTFEEAVDTTIDALRTQIKKAKEKANSIH